MMVAAFILLIIFSVPSYGQTPTPPIATDKPKTQNANPQKKPSSEQRGTEQAPLIIKILPSPSDEKPTESTANEQQGHPADWWWDRSPEILLAIATFGLWIATRQLVRGSENTARRQLRAYVGIHVASLTQPLLGTIRVRIEVKNTGHTPAYNVRTWSFLGIFDPPPEVPKFITGEKTDIYSMIGSGAVIELHDGREGLKHDVINGITNGTKPIYFWGEIRYQDVFAIERRTIFRLRARLQPRENWYFDTTPEGNEAD